jgi:cytochrome c oxidase assembly protein subunit 11
MSATLALDRNRRVGLAAAGVALAMGAMGFAAVPLYRMFCQATGFAGTPQRAS